MPIKHIDISILANVEHFDDVYITPWAPQHTMTAGTCVCISIENQGFSQDMSFSFLVLAHSDDIYRGP